MLSGGGERHRETDWEGGREAFFDEFFFFYKIYFIRKVDVQSSE